MPRKWQRKILVQFGSESKPCATCGTPFFAGKFKPQMCCGTQCQYEYRLFVERTDPRYLAMRRERANRYRETDKGAETRKAYRLRPETIARESLRRQQIDYREKRVKKQLEYYYKNRERILAEQRAKNVRYRAIRWACRSIGIKIDSNLPKHQQDKSLVLALSQLGVKL